MLVITAIAAAMNKNKEPKGFILSFIILFALLFISMMFSEVFPLRDFYEEKYFEEKCLVYVQG